MHGVILLIAVESAVQIAVYADACARAPGSAKIGQVLVRCSNQCFQAGSVDGGFSGPVGLKLAITIHCPATHLAADNASHDQVALGNRCIDHAALDKQIDACSGHGRIVVGQSDLLAENRWRLGRKGIEKRPQCQQISLRHAEVGDDEIRACRAVVVERKTTNLGAGSGWRLKSPPEHAYFLILVPKVRNLEVLLARLRIIGTKASRSKSSSRRIDRVTLSADFQLACLDADDAIVVQALAVYLDSGKAVVERTPGQPAHQRLR